MTWGWDGQGTVLEVGVLSIQVVVLTLILCGRNVSFVYR